MHGALTNIADYLDDVIGAHAAAKPAPAIDIGMRHGPARIGFESQSLRHPQRAEAIGHGGEIAAAGARESVEETMHAFEHGARAGKSGAAEQRCSAAGLRRPAGVKPFRPSAF